MAARRRRSASAAASGAERAPMAETGSQPGRHRRRRADRRSGVASAAASGAERAHMAEPGSSPVRELVERLLLAGVGAVSLTAERADALADELAEKGGLRKEEARELVGDA